jgi:hypothetical protein
VTYTKALVQPVRGGAPERLSRGRGVSWVLPLFVAAGLTAFAGTLLLGRIGRAATVNRNCRSSSSTGIYLRIGALAHHQMRKLRRGERGGARWPRLESKFGGAIVACA